MAILDNSTIETVNIQVEYAIGPRGYSAYEIAVQNGFVGTQEEWEASLVGPKGDDFTFDDFTPEEIELLQQPSIDAAEIADVATANTNTAISQANTARDNANTAASSANTATSNANTATSAANTATSNAENATAQTIQVKNDTLQVKEDTLQAKNETVTATNNSNTATSQANTARDNANTATSQANTARDSANAAKASADLATADSIAKTALTVTATANANAKIAEMDVIKANFEAPFKTVNVGSSGLVTISPTTLYGTYKLTVLANIIINFSLQDMINKVGSARGRLIIDMPILKTITFAKPILWGGAVPTFASAGQYIFEFVNSDGNNPLIWLVSSTLKAETTGVILYVDGTSATYADGDITIETATRLANSWATPFKYIQNAINVAVAGDVIFVKQGTYYPTHLRTTPTVFASGNQLDRNATFTPKTGVDVYGGFVGTETKTWQRAVDTKGFPTNKTILNGDVLREAVIDGAKTIGDLRTDASKANAVYNVVYGSVASYTYLNGFDVKYGYANGSGNQAYGAGIHSINNLVSTNCVANNNTAITNGGGFSGGNNTNCVANNNTAITNGGGFSGGNNTNCVANNNTALGGGGGGFYQTNSDNCIAINNTALGGGGFFQCGTVNCTAINNTANNPNGSITGGGFAYGFNRNNTVINNKGVTAVYGENNNYTNINCLVINNKNASNLLVGFANITATSYILFRNNAYDTANPTITSSNGTSDIQFGTCLPLITLATAKITVPSFVGATTDPAQLAELDVYLANIKTHLKPLAGSILKGAGINNATYSNPTDFNGVARPTNSTIGILEGA